MSTSILLVDDHQMMRDGLRALLEKRGEMRVVGEASSGNRGVDMARALEPDVVVMDIGMRDLNGIEATRQVLSNRPQTKVIGLSMHSDKRYVTNMLNAGASAYLLKNCASDELVRAIRTVMSGGRFVSAEIADLAPARAAREARGDGSAYSMLTPREREVLQLVAEGRTSASIAGRLHVALKTVETHRRSIMKKLGLNNVADLTRYAIREGIASAEL